MLDIDNRFAYQDAAFESGEYIYYSVCLMWIPFFLKTCNLFYFHIAKNNSPYDKNNILSRNLEALSSRCLETRFYLYSEL